MRDKRQLLIGASLKHQDDVFHRQVVINDAGIKLHAGTRMHAFVQQRAIAVIHSLTDARHRQGRATLWPALGQNGSAKQRHRK